MINIAVPQNRLFDKFVAGANEAVEKFGIKLIRAEEKKCGELMLNNLVQAAMLTPTGYGMGVKIADYRIIDGPSLTSDGYTDIASIYLRRGALRIEKAASPTPEDFMMLAGKILLAERYEIYPRLEKIAGSAGEILSSADAAIVWGPHLDNQAALDISEDWLDTFETPLPVGFWVCRPDEHPENIRQIIDTLASGLDRREEIINEAFTPGMPADPRSGRLLWQWDEEAEDALEQTLEYLYFHQALNELPAVKILGRD